MPLYPYEEPTFAQVDTARALVAALLRIMDDIDIVTRTVVISRGDEDVIRKWIEATK